MKHQIIRRAGATVLALALALTLTVPAWATGETLSISGKTTLKVGDSGDNQTTLTATWSPNAPGDDITYSWECADDTVSLSANDGESITVTAKKAGEAKITLTATGGEIEGTAEASCKLTVSEDTAPDPGETDPPVTTDPPETSAPPVTTDPPEPTGPSLVFVGGDDLRTKDDPTRWNLQVILSGVGNSSSAEIIWSVSRRTPSDKTILPTFDGIGFTKTDEDGSEGTGGSTVTIVSHGAGEFVVTAKYAADPSISATKNVTISGITLTNTELTMVLGETVTIALDKPYGRANDGTTLVYWTSSDSSIVYVTYGTLRAQKVGTAIITATLGDYSAECVVTVTEDDTIIAGPYSQYNNRPISASNPLILSAAWNRLDEISMDKTEGKGVNEGVAGSPLNYITNVQVPTSQGTLYYNYSSEADTGAGVGFTDVFMQNPGGASTRLDIKKLYFVPRQGFKGTAEITFTGWSMSGVSFSGVIKVEVGEGTGTDGEPVPISYRTPAGEPVWFMTSDFNAYCQSKTGRNVNYVTFNLPQASQGTLYYNYTAGSGNLVSTTTQFTQSGRYTLNDVCFVPNAAFVSDTPVTITFRCVDTSGTVFNGTLEVTVTASGSNSDPTNVYISGERGKPVVLQNSLFNDACQQTIHDTLAYVTFKLPDPGDGTLYYNYRSENSFDSRVNALTHYYYSGVPSISGVAFVPASNATGRVAISYTGYGSTGTSFTGKLYITMDEADRTTIRYFVSKNSFLNFNASDFILAGLYQMGASVEYVTFDLYGFNYDLGDLYYDYLSSYSYGQVYSGVNYYVETSYTWANRLSLISFRAKDTAGTITIPYTAYGPASGSDYTRKSFTGDLVIQVGSPTPTDIRLSCNNRDQARLSSVTLINACRPAMNDSLSYIEITNVPDAEQGHLYFNYSGFGTGTVVKKGDRFYCYNDPTINLLRFVPRAGFSGEAEITYIGYSSNAQEQVSGRILVSVSQSTASLYFNDMRNHVWAIDSVDYLYQNRTVEGVGGGRFNPTGTITKGDFTLMLVRAYGLTASGSASFKDVPAGSYYADAIRIASLLGIASGSNGYYNPKAALSRQDAMLMIFNALKASGRTVTNGLTADLSVFYDEDDIAEYAREAVGSLVQMGVVEGNGNGYLRPRNLLNRAETAKLLHAIMTL